VQSLSATSAHKDHMAKKNLPSESQPPIVMKVFEDFVGSLEQDATVDGAVIKRLSKTLLEEQDYSVEAIRSALFTEDFPS
jgi:hypothetical protein